ncbi:hypothetical protein QFC22_005554 [Naganishia vaughanmartiniae]|uniref:Uncharacterized protein n=1 Tax=Naganishia vaughanmartiniae TaxID=1424756 RepID=A0ACC2WTB3_9TREE|nr:hypothetical protein QFC22_005554 [Naganishia vaughanmartiniae]
MIPLRWHITPHHRRIEDRQLRYDTLSKIIDEGIYEDVTASYWEWTKGTAPSDEQLDQNSDWASDSWIDCGIYRLNHNAQQYYYVPSVEQTWVRANATTQIAPPPPIGSQRNSPGTSQSHLPTATHPHHHGGDSLSIPQIEGGTTARFLKVEETDSGLGKVPEDIAIDTTASTGAKRNAPDDGAEPLRGPRGRKRVDSRHVGVEDYPPSGPSVSSVNVQDYRPPLLGPEYCGTGKGVVSGFPSYNHRDTTNISHLAEYSGPVNGSNCDFDDVGHTSKEPTSELLQYHSHKAPIHKSTSRTIFECLEFLFTYANGLRSALGNAGVMDQLNAPQNNRNGGEAAKNTHKECECGERSGSHTPIQLLMDKAIEKEGRTIAHAAVQQQSNFRSWSVDAVSSELALAFSFAKLEDTSSDMVVRPNSL